jgi:hypothetical protein
MVLNPPDSTDLLDSLKREQQGGRCDDSGMSPPTVDDLHAALGDVLEFLERHSLPEADEVQKALQEVAASDAHGARRYLWMNRTLLDIYFSPVNGNASDERDGDRLNEEWRALHHRAFTLAETLLRASR